MAISGKYGKLDIPKVDPDEPVFVLRAQDKLALPTLKMYQALLYSHGCNLAETVQREIDIFERWTGERKMPD